MNNYMDMLIERMDENYEEFRSEMLSLDSETVFENARTIAAMSDVLFYFTTHDWVDEDEAAYLLDFSNPLKMIAEAWEEHLDDGDQHFRKVLESVIDCEDNEENYMTMALERELREKYGEDTSITGALIAEVLEAGSRYLALKGIYESLGADDWDED